MKSESPGLEGSAKHLAARPSVSDFMQKLSKPAKRSHSEVDSSDGEISHFTTPDVKRNKTTDEDGDLDEEKVLAALIEDSEKWLQLFERLKQRKAEKNGAFKARDLDSNTRKTLKQLAKKVLPIGATLYQEDEEIRKRPQQFEPTYTALPSTSTLTGWSEADILTGLPPLPPVLNGVVEQAAFTHLGMAARVGDLSYERLEWLGDAYVQIISTGLIYATFGHLQPGKMAQMRERLIRNSQMAEYGVWYGFDKRANFPAEFGLGGRPGGTQANLSQREKVIADIFEAYVSAVILSDPLNGFARASTWLKHLWAGTLAHEIRTLPREIAKTQELPAKTRLATLIVVKGIKIRYEDAPCSQRDRHSGALLFTVNCFLDGWGETNKLLGWGTARSKKEAGEKAAQSAMDNKKLISKYIQIKKDFMAAQEAQAKEEEE